MDRITDRDLSVLTALCPGGFERDVDLSAISRWRVGGRADLLLRPSSTAEVIGLMRWFSARNIHPVVIGLTTNLLFDDAGLRIPCIEIGRRMAHVTITETKIYAQAGAWVPGLARKLMQEGLGGGEHICGIPGALGGLIYMNGGSQRKGIGSNVVSVESVDGDGTFRQRLAKDCDFAYRHSVFQNSSEVITGASLCFYRRDRQDIRAEMLEILADRRRKFPQKEPNCGSVFKSDPAMYEEVGPPGAVIERLGFKGKRVNDAQVSPKHANFIVNTGKAKAADVLALIHQIAAKVEAETGYCMDAECSYVSPDGHIQPANQLPERLA